MSRPPRNSYAGAFFHVHTRGNNKARAFVDAIDREIFLALLERSQQRFGWEVYAWCLMTTHYHVVMRVIDDGLSAGMCQLNGGFARWTNARHGRCDHVFGKRFTSNEITTDGHFLEACRYVVLNPVRAGLCAAPHEWRWSSYRASIEVEPAQTFLALAGLHRFVANQFGCEGGAAADVFREFVSAGLVEPGQTVPGIGRQM